MGYSCTMTRAGHELQAQLLAGGTDLVITCAVVGSGVCPGGSDPALRVGLVEPRAEATTTTPVQDGQVVRLAVEYRSDLDGGVDEEFQICEFGVFAAGAGGEEILLLYGDLSDAPETAVPQSKGGCVRRYPIAITVGPCSGVDLAFPAGACVTAEELSAALSARRRVIATRVRDPSKPTYGLEPGGGGEAEVLLAVGPYTGAAAVSAVVSGVEYDAENVSVNGENVPDGTLILRKLEET